MVHSQIEVERLRGIIPIEKMRVIPHFVESRELPLTPDEARAKLGLGDRRVVTLLGFVYGRKGHRYAVEAVPFMPDDAIMVYAGGPVAGPYLRLRPGTLRRQRSWGWATASASPAISSDEELGTWIAATHLAILPFTDLSASGSMSSWISSGKPMLVSDLPGTREYARRVPGALNFFGPAGEPWPLGSAINELLARPLPDPDPGVQRLARELSMAQDRRSLPRRSHGRRWPAPERPPGDYGVPASSPQQLRLVGALPGQVQVLATEVAVGRGLPVDRAPQVEGADDAARAQVEVPLDELLDLVRRG